jgi:phosphoglycerate dehydrogenase-like enzyme
VAVAVLSSNKAWTMPPRCLEDLRGEFPQHTFIGASDPDALVAALSQADAAFSSIVPAGLVPSLPRLRWVQVPAAGVGHLLSPELVDSAIVLTSARGIRAVAIAEHVMAAALALVRQIHTAVRRQTEHQWALDEIETGGRVVTLHGRQIGIVGLGSIGREVARRAHAFGMKVVGIRRHTARPLPDGVARVLAPDALLELLAESDIVVLATPLTAETHHLIDRRALGAVKRGAFLVNIGRGGLVDEDALLDALRSGWLGGAALDVFATEPLPADNPFWDLPNVIVTPHVAGAMEDYWTPLMQLFADNLRRFERGEALLNVVDKRAGY